MNNYFPERHRTLKAQIKDLRKEIPATMEGFAKLHSSSLANGALSTLTKELIALAIGISMRCDGCIAFHVHDALRAGAQRAEILETIGVAVMMGGGPSLMYGCEALEALNQFETAVV